MVLQDERCIKAVDYSLVIDVAMDGPPTRFVRSCVRNDLGKAAVEQRGRGLLCIIWLTVSSLTGPKMNARQQRHVGALGNTFG
jgi:hypothetical protein